MTSVGIKENIFEPATTNMKYTVIRVKRKITDDPEKALTVNSKKRKVDDIFQYCGSLPLDSGDAKIKEITIGTKRTADSLREKVVQSLATIENKLSPVPSRKKVKASNESLIFDILHEEIINKKQIDEITLNGAKLIREQLNISENKKELDDYVYDIYYAPRDIDLEPEDLVFEGHEVFTSVMEETRPDWDEDEDSNDEDNWRNDYPDTESSDGEYQDEYYDRERDRGDFCSDRDDRSSDDYEANYGGFESNDSYDVDEF